MNTYDLIKKFNLESKTEIKEKTLTNNYYIVNIGNYNIEVVESMDTSIEMNSIIVWDNRFVDSSSKKDYRNIDKNHFLTELESTFEKYLLLETEEKKEKIIAIIKKSSSHTLKKELPELFKREDVIIVIEEDSSFEKIINM